MLDVQAVDRDQSKRHHQDQMTEAAMADEPEDPDAAADRLEAALERIARLATLPPAPPDDPPDRPDSDLSIPEIAERLDSLIARLRTALGDGDKGDGDKSD
jgi:hypothetical protein